MPKRTTPFQMVVHFVRKHLAKPGVTVTESKLLRDVVLDVKREVDVVIEGDFDGDPVVTSVEVIEHKRPASVTWVQGQIERHRHLPTNRLVLVSKSGFSKTALKAVWAQGGWVEALRPEVVEINGKPVVKRLFFDSVRLTPVDHAVLLRGPDGENIKAVDVAGGTNVYDDLGELLGSLSQLAAEAVNLEWVGTKIIADAHGHPERNNLTGFSCMFTLDQLDYYLRKDDTGELHRIRRLVIAGPLAFAQDEIPFTLAHLGDRRYGAGEATLMGRPTVWAATSDQDARTTTISWRTADDKPLLDLPRQPPMLFPALLTLVPPPDLRVPSVPVAAPDGEATNEPPEPSGAAEVGQGTD